MSTDARIAGLIEKALAAGISQESLVGMLTARGWPEREIYDALAEHYERTAGLEVPYRGSTAASARDAFFYLLIFATLGTWTIGFGILASTLVDRWLVDPLFAGYGQGFDTNTITWSLATLIVAFPLFLLVSRAVAADTAVHPEKLESGIRKWLTYMALVIAASVFMGELITALSYLLRGELTSRFLLKALVVLALSGGVFFYYFGGLRKSGDAASRKRRDRLMAVIASAAVVLLAVAGFGSLGAPRRQRELRADGQRVMRLYQLSSAVKAYWTAHNSTLPSGLEQLPGSFLDPVTRRPLTYRPEQGSRYELCANFDRNSNGTGDTDGAAGADEWVHPAGQHCFELNASVQANYPVSAVNY